MKEDEELVLLLELAELPCDPLTASTAAAALSTSVTGLAEWWKAVEKVSAVRSLQGTLQHQRPVPNGLSGSEVQA